MERAATAGCRSPCPHCSAPARIDPQTPSPRCRTRAARWSAARPVPAPAARRASKPTLEKLALSTEYVHAVSPVWPRVLH
eukprot:5162758-Prymnesium_polylepis.1